MRAGYTLTEILVITLLLTLAVGVVLPTYLGEPQLEDTERLVADVERVIGNARRRATESARRVMVSVTGTTTTELKTWRMEDNRWALIRTDHARSSSARLQQIPLTFRLSREGAVSGDSIVIRASASALAWKVDLDGTLRKSGAE